MPIKYQPQLKATMFGRMPVGGEKPKDKRGLPAYKGPKGVRTEHRIGVHAPPEVIWALISDLEGWANWNPLYPQASGDIHIGAPLDMTLALPGEKPQKLRATVLDWVPNEQLHYQITALGGLVRAIRYIEIEALTPESCIVSNGEIMGGLLGPSIARGIQARVYKGLRLMNEALKAQAESRWQATAST
jgi:hypothetical protein